MQFAEVTWADTLSDNTWITEGEIEPPDVILSRGWVVRVTDNYVALAGTRGDGKEFNQVISIPRGMIMRVRILEGDNTGGWPDYPVR